MPNSSKVAFLFHGKPQAHSTATPLEYIANDIEKMKKILEPSWTIQKEGLLERSFFSEESLLNYKTNELNIIFYFTGHGIDYQYGESVEYTLMLSDDHKQNITIKELVKDIMTHLSPKTLTIVLDACYSGQAKIETDSNKDIQLLSSSNYTQESYESWGVEGGLFTHFFCQAINNSCGEDESAKITLKDIANYIREPLNKQNQGIVEKSINLGEVSSLAIAYNKEVLELKTKIKQHYQNKELSKEKQVDTFKYDILRFYPRTKEEIYKGIRTSKSMDDLLDVLFGDRKSSYLYCILKFLEIEDKYTNTFKGDKECKEVNAKVEGIIVVVESNTNNDIYRAEIYCVLDNEKVEESGEIAETTWKNLYKKELVVELEKILAMNCVAKLELQMVLPIKLMKSEFKKENICMGEVEGMPDNFEWEEKFNITTKFLSRLKGYGSENDNRFTFWNDNLILYSNRSEEIIDANIVENVSSFYENKALFLVSENSLVDDKNLVKLYSLGIPFVITTQKDKYAFTSDEEYKTWTKSKVKNIKNSSFAFINEMPKALHFLCDDGYSNKFLEVFQKMGNDESRIENFIGEEDYE